MPSPMMGAYPPRHAVRGLLEILAKRTTMSTKLVLAGVVGAFAIGAFAAGAVALGALAIGRLAIGRARVGRLEIDELIVRRSK